MHAASIEASGEGYMTTRKESQGAVTLFVPKLQDTPGWLVLSRKKQDELLERTSRIMQNRQLKLLGEFGELMELYQVQHLIEGEEMKIDDYIGRLYEGKEYRTIHRKRTIFQKLEEKIGRSGMNRMASVGADILSQFSRIANAALGDILNAVQKVPALTDSSSNSDVKKYLENVETELAQERKARKKPQRKDETIAAKMATNAVLSYMRAASLQTSAQKRNWLTRIMGWVMEAQAVTGTLRAGRIAIPDGILVRRGRPRKYPKKVE
jgi:hypothetical protein